MSDCSLLLSSQNVEEIKLEEIPRAELMYRVYEINQISVRQWGNYQEKSI